MRKRAPTSLLVLALAFLGCQPATAVAAAPEPAATSRARPIDADPAVAEEVGRTALREIGYDRIMRLAAEAKWIRYGRSNPGNVLGQEAEAIGMWAVFTRYAVAAGVASQVDSPAPGPGDVAQQGHDQGAAPRQAPGRAEERRRAVAKSLRLQEAGLPMIPTPFDDAIHDAWGPIPAPPAEDLKYMAWGWGEESWHAFVNVAPMDVNIESGAFLVCMPLLDLPPRAAAAYLGPYLLAFLRELEFQKKMGWFAEVRLRAHVITCLTTRHFWEDIRPYLPPKCREVLAQVTLYAASEHENLFLTPEQMETMRALAADFLKSADSTRDNAGDGN